MTKSQILAVSCATTLDGGRRRVKSITLDVMEADVTSHPSLGCVLNITEVTRVFTDLETKASRSVTTSLRSSCENSQSDS